MRRMKLLYLVASYRRMMSSMLNPVRLGAAAAAGGAGGAM